jgi:isopentenyl-diphosphate Delta-isomerase
MSAGEMIDVLNSKGEVIDTMLRELAEHGDHITQNVLVFIFDSKGNAWVQHRPLNKKHYPGKWDISACGGVISGESPEEAAHRETLEETGIQVTLYYVESFLNVFPGENGETRRRLSHLYIGASDELPRVNTDVDEFKICQPVELKEDIASFPEAYVPSFLTELNKALEGYSRLKSTT